ncbi:rCG47021 [Rattus norvegicus]|uniref:RCG47021 n=1 Tax=Rattus norvegicus TaxID=10116 RepID=A6K4Y3_RAT|nr:rCG47021 [Rattus norvegicus]
MKIFQLKSWQEKTYSNFLCRKELRTFLALFMY